VLEIRTSGHQESKDSPRQLGAGFHGNQAKETRTMQRTTGKEQKNKGQQARQQDIRQ